MLAKHKILIKVLTTNINQTLFEKKRIFSYIFYSKLGFFYFLENFYIVCNNTTVAFCFALLQKDFGNFHKLF